MLAQDLRQSWKAWRSLGLHYTISLWHLRVALKIWTPEPKTFAMTLPPILQQKRVANQAKGIRTVKYGNFSLMDRTEENFKATSTIPLNERRCCERSARWPAGDLSLRLSSFEEYNHNIIVCLGYLLSSTDQPLFSHFKTSIGSLNPSKGCDSLPLRPTHISNHHVIRNQSISIQLQVLTGKFRLDHAPWLMRWILGS